MARQTVAAGAQPGNTGPAGSGGGGSPDEYVIAPGGGAAAGGVGFTLDRSPNWPNRVGKVVVGIGLTTCEIVEMQSSAGAAVTSAFKFHFAHNPGERVLFFGGSVVPFTWWGAVANDSTVDCLFNYQCAVNAIRRTETGLAQTVTLDGQNRQWYMSGPHYVPQNIAIVNFYWLAKTSGAGYTGPMDGPDNASLTTNAFSDICQSEDRYTYDQATNLFQLVDAAGAAKADNNVHVNSPMKFAPSGNGLTVPAGLVPGRLYKITEKPTPSSFRLGLIDGGSTISFASNGAGFVGGQAGTDNCKLYADRITLGGVNVGQYAFTATDAGDLFTTTLATPIANGDVIRFNLPDLGALPTGVEEGINTYIAINVNAGARTFQASVDGVNPVSLTTDGSGYVLRSQNALNGLGWAMQQNSKTDTIRVNNCKGFGIRIRTQQSHWRNLELINNGNAIETGNEFGSGANFLYVYTYNIEDSDMRNLYVRAVTPAIHLHDGHIEERNPVRNFVHFDIEGATEDFQLNGTWVGSASTVGKRILFRVNTGQQATVDYTIRNLRGTFPGVSGALRAIEDHDRGVCLDMRDDFGNEGWALYQSWSTSSAPTTNLDPHPFRFDGLHGQFEGHGSEGPGLPYRVTRVGALKTADARQWQQWIRFGAPTNATLDLASGTFTLAGHAFTNDQKLHLVNLTTATPNAPFYWVSGGQCCFVVNANVGAGTFQVAKFKGGPPVTFSAGPTTAWQVRYIGPVTARIDQFGRVVQRRRRKSDGTLLAPAAADFVADEWWAYWEPTDGAPVMRVAGKTANGTFVDQLV